MAEHEPLIYEKVDEIHSIGRRMTHRERVEHSISEYNATIEDLRKGVDGVALGVGHIMTDRKAEMLLNMLDELHDQLLAADANMETVAPGGKIPASSEHRKVLMWEINTLRDLILKHRISSIDLRKKTRITLSIAHATEHAPLIAQAAMERMVYTK